MGTQSARLSSDFSLPLADVGETVSLVHKVAQVLNTVTGAYTEVQQTQNVTAIPSLLSKKELELNSNKFFMNDRVFRFREEDLTVATITIDDTITYDGVTYRIIEVLHEILGIIKVYGRKV